MGTIRQIVYQIAESIFSVPKEQLTEETAVGSIPQWDSMAHMALISALEEKFSIEFDMDELFDAETLGDLIELIESSK